MPFILCRHILDYFASWWILTSTTQYTLRKWSRCTKERSGMKFHRMCMRLPTLPIDACFKVSSLYYNNLAYDLLKRVFSRGTSYLIRWSKSFSSVFGTNHVNVHENIFRMTMIVWSRFNFLHGLGLVVASSVVALVNYLCFTASTSSWFYWASAENWKKNLVIVVLKSSKTKMSLSLPH